MNLFTKLRLIPIRFWGNVYFKNAAIKKAKKMHLKTGKRYRVYFLDRRYRVLTRDDVQRMKHQGLFRHGINTTNMTHLIFFDTHPHLNV